MANTEDLAATVEVLRRMGLNAAVQDTGGGIECIVVAGADGALDAPTFIFGRAGATWAGEVEGHASGVDTDLDSAESEPKRVASAIIRSIGEFVAAG